jgi:hypothetical protein
LAELGQRLINGTTKKLTDEFFAHQITTPSRQLEATISARTVISSTTGRRSPIPYSKPLRRQRDLTKRIFTCMKDFRRVALRQVRTELRGQRYHRRNRSLVAQVSPTLCDAPEAGAILVHMSRMRR